jgi:hypothetical protein
MEAQINFFGIKITTRGFIFQIIGVLCGIYFVFTLTDFAFFPRFDFWFRISSVAFIFVYPMFTSIIAAIFPAYLRWYRAVPNVFLYSIGGLVGVAFSFLILFIILVASGLFAFMHFLIGIF